MRPEVAFFQKVYGSLGKRRFGRLTGEAAKANYMLLIALHLSLWMLCTNRTRIQANAGASRLIDTVAEFPNDPRCQELFEGCDEALLWIVVAGIAYARYSLRQPFADLRLSALARRRLKRCGIRDVEQMRDVVGLFAGQGVWCRDSLLLVLEEVGWTEGSIDS